MANREVVRRVEIPLTVCACNALLNHVNIYEWQPQPGEGDHVICPTCATVHVLVAGLKLEVVRESRIPPDILAQREEMLAVKALTHA